jgi:integrase/recombinase XerD
MTDAKSAQRTTAHLTPESTLIQALEAWKIYLEDQGRSPHTIRAFSADINLLVGYLPPDRAIGTITTKELNLFLDWLQNGRGVPCSPKTLARRITSIKAIYRWLKKGGIVLIDPAERVVQKSVTSPLPTVLTFEEVDLAFETAEKLAAGEDGDIRPLALFGLLIHTGIKKSECLNLTPNHMELDAEQPFIFVRYASPQHRYKERKINVPTTWVDTYRKYSAQYDTNDKVFPWSPRRLEYLLEDITNAAGIEKHISFAMCRWTSALIDMENGIENEKIRQKLGISKIQWREVKSKLLKLSKQAENSEKED